MSEGSEADRLIRWIWIGIAVLVLTALAFAVAAYCISR